MILNGCCAGWIGGAEISAFRMVNRAAIERDLADGISVIADRYAFSGIAFSAAKVSSTRLPPFLASSQLMSVSLSL